MQFLTLPHRLHGLVLSGHKFYFVILEHDEWYPFEGIIGAADDA